MSVQENPLSMADCAGTMQLEGGITKEAPPNAPTIAIAATFTAEPLGEFLEFWIGTLQIPAKVEFAPYNHVMQCLLDPGGLFARNKAGMNVVLVRFEDWNRFGGGVQSDASVRDKVKELTSALKAAVQNFSAPLLLCICPASGEVAADAERAELFAEAETEILKALKDFSMIRCVSSGELGQRYPVSDFWDSGSDTLGHIPYTPEMFAALGTTIMRTLQSTRRAPFKVIVLDCDNTLWSGVCGERDPLGVEIDPFRQTLQRHMKAQQEVGVLLCVCSKNTAEDVDAVFNENRGMLLKKSDITGWRVNWEPKSQNIRSLAKELQLGLDSFIFVDDNPAEIAEVQANCPGVLALTLPGSVEQIPRYLDHIWALDRFSVTADDKKRASTYQVNHLRKKLQMESASYADFLAGLALEIEIRELKPGEENRAAQLTQRTNQFNMVTRRCTEAEVQQMIHTGETLILTAFVRDRLGDYGQVGLIMCGRAGGCLQVRNFMLSCRVLGKGVEHAILAHLGKIARAESLSHVEVPYIETKKNIPARNFLTSFPAEYREDTGQGSVFRFPADFAAAVSFSPEHWEPTEVEGEAGEQAARTSGDYSGNREDFQRIATALDTPKRILDAVLAAGRVSALPKGSLVPPESDTEKQLAGIWEKVLRLDEVGIDNDFFDLGGQSLMAVRLFAEINRQFELNLGLATIFEARTVRRLAHLIDSRQSGKKPDAGGFISLVPIQPNGMKPPLFLIHGIGGNILNYEHLVRSLDRDQPAYGLQSRGLVGHAADVSVEQMAEHYIQEIRRLQPEGPYFICGHSFGGLVAYEIGCRLEAQGQSLGMVGLVDTFQKKVPQAKGLALMAAKARWQTNRVKTHARMLLLGPDRVGYVKARVRTARRLISTYLYKRQVRHYLATGADLPPVLQDVRQTNWIARNQYEPKPYKGLLVLFRCETRSLIDDPDYSMGWGNLAKGALRVVEVPGDHNTLMSPPNVAVLGQKLTEYLSEESHGTADRVAVAS